MKDNQQNAESKLEQTALDNCVCKTGDCVHYNSFIRGANWQSLTTPAWNEVEVLINEFYELYRKFEKDPDEDEHPYNRGVRVGKSITYANVVNRMREFLNSIATHSKPHTVEEAPKEQFEPGDHIDIGTGYDCDRGVVVKCENGNVHWDSYLGGQYKTPMDKYNITLIKKKAKPTPPPAPIKTEGEDEIKQEFKELRTYIEDLYHGAGKNMQIWIELSDKMNAFERKVLAGYAASLPQSSKSPSGDGDAVDDKRLRFAEWTASHGWSYDCSAEVWDRSPMIQPSGPFTTAELYQLYLQSNK